MSGEAELSGPDLTQGVALADLPDGGQLLGQSGGEAVLVVRRGEEIFAIGATCTHYGGPLAEGVVDGDTVRCPWHHACFSLRTGEALRAPALNPVACYKVEREGDRITIREKIDRSPPSRRRPAPIPSSSSAPAAAGNAAAEMLRREGYQGPIRMIGARGRGPLRPPQPLEGLPRRQRARGVDSRSVPASSTPSSASSSSSERGRRRSIPQAKTVTLSDGRSLAYGALLLATGAEPIRLPIPGADRPSSTSCARSRTAARSSRRPRRRSGRW